MSNNILNKIENKYVHAKHPEISVGDMVEIDFVIREGARQRIQKFKGLVIAIKGSGTRKMITVRKISYGVGVEKQFPLYSPNVSTIVILKHGNVRRAKLYYLRNRIGKAALKVKAGKNVVNIENELELEIVEPSDESELVESTQDNQDNNPEVVVDNTPEESKKTAE